MTHHLNNDEVNNILQSSKFLINLRACLFFNCYPYSLAHVCHESKIFKQSTIFELLFKEFPHQHEFPRKIIYIVYESEYDHRSFLLLVVLSYISYSIHIFKLFKTLITKNILKISTREIFKYDRNKSIILKHGSIVYGESIHY